MAPMLCSHTETPAWRHLRTSAEMAALETRDSLVDMDLALLVPEAIFDLNDSAPRTQVDDESACAMQADEHVGLLKELQKAAAAGRAAAARHTSKSSMRGRCHMLAPRGPAAPRLSCTQRPMLLPLLHAYEKPMREGCACWPLASMAVRQGHASWPPHGYGRA